LRREPRSLSMEEESFEERKSFGLWGWVCEGEYVRR
jgi:hypothetical protein